MKLKRGDLVYIVAPASQFRGADRDLLSEAVLLLESWHLQVEVRVDAGHHFYLAGPDEVRVGHFTAALANPKAKAVFCTRGGYGSARLLQRLDPGARPATKLVIGHSDITSLHLAIAKLWPQIVSIHGPNVATRQLLGDGIDCELNRRSLHDALFADDYMIVESLEFLRLGKANGPILGGCLSLVASAIGTGFTPDFSGKILFLEDTGEPPYRIDRMLTQLRNAGVFDQLRGVVFGVMTKCTDAYNDLKSVIKDVLVGTSYPIAFGLRSGHGSVNLSIRLGSHVEMDSNIQTIRIHA